VSSRLKLSFDFLDLLSGVKCPANVRLMSGSGPFLPVSVGQLMRV
jgi:hypothetical protein